jgi:signal transduction histidine kinase
MDVLEGLAAAHQLFRDQEGLDKAQEEARQIQLASQQLKNQYEALKSQPQPAATNQEEINLLRERQTSLQELVKHLDSRNRELEEMLTKSRPSMDEVEQLRQELRSALADLARIPTTLSKSDQNMLELRLSAMNQLDELGKTEMVTSISQEIRQPLASITGYTELLLGESIGILGAMQRKFLERIKASTERLTTLMNDLVQYLTFEEGKLDHSIERLDLKGVVEEAVGDVMAQVREKNIKIRVNMAEGLPEIPANKDALQQILVNLLQNACLVTPADAEISLTAKIEQQENEPDYLLLSVTDQGCGISKVDLPRIFLRQYRADNPTIKGIGETGVGLSIAKSLVELYKGRIWVDSKEGTGSTFSCLIPLTPF